MVHRASPQRSGRINRLSCNTYKCVRTSFTLSITPHIYSAPYHSPKTLSPAVTIGSAIGAAVVGLIIGAIISFFLLHHRDRTNREFNKLSQASSHQDPTVAAHNSGESQHYHVVSTSSMPYQDRNSLSTSISPNPLFGQQYHVEPFILPTEEVPMPPRDTRRDTFVSYHDGPTSPRPVSEPDTSSLAPSSQQQQVYVVHHDGGRAPVTVYTPGGTEVVELPPGYPGRRLTQQGRVRSPSSQGDESTELPYQDGRGRHAGPLPRKGSSSNYPDQY
jgi:hypothetical protein